MHGAALRSPLAPLRWQRCSASPGQREPRGLREPAGGFGSCSRKQSEKINGRFTKTSILFNFYGLCFSQKQGLEGFSLQQKWNRFTQRMINKNTRHKIALRFRLFSINQFSLKAKLVLGISCILAIFSAFALFNYAQMENIRGQISLQNAKTDHQLTAMELKNKVQELDVISSGLIISKNEDWIERYRQEAENFRALTEKIIAAAHTAEQRKWSATLRTVSDEYVGNFDKAVEIIRGTDTTFEEMSRALENVYRLSQAHKQYIFATIDQFNQAFAGEAAQATSATESLLDKSSVLSAIILPVVLLIALGIAMLLIRSFAAPIRSLETSVNRIAEGDLTHKINARKHDELGRLSKAFDQMADKVGAILGKTRQVAWQLRDHTRDFQQFSSETAAAASELSQAVAEISQGTDFQANRLEESSRLIETMEKQAGSVMACARVMKEATQEAAALAQNGEETVETLVKSAKLTEEMLGKVRASMETLTAIGKEVGQMTQSIAEISEQTNILALNASIEAAREKAQGKGFSVIAAEVRKLSRKTKDSAKSIGSLIRALQEQTEALRSDILKAKETVMAQNIAVEQTGRAFQDIFDAVDHMARQGEQIHGEAEQMKEVAFRIVGSIQSAAAIAEQTAASVQEVNTIFVRQDSSVRQIAEQSQGIHALAEQLIKEINEFKLNVSGPAD
jgi:methyl-accepting chemotaxis protein